MQSWYHSINGQYLNFVIAFKKVGTDAGQEVTKSAAPASKSADCRALLRKVKALERKLPPNPALRSQFGLMLTDFELGATACLQNDMSTELSSFVSGTTEYQLVKPKMAALIP